MTTRPSYVATWVMTLLVACGDDVGSGAVDEGAEDRSPSIEERTEKTIEAVLRARQATPPSRPSSDAGRSAEPALPPGCRNYLDCCEAMRRWTDAGPSDSCDYVRALARRSNANEMCEEIMAKLRESLEDRAGAPAECR